LDGLYGWYAYGCCWWMAGDEYDDELWYGELDGYWTSLTWPAEFGRRDVGECAEPPCATAADTPTTEVGEPARCLLCFLRLGLYL